jgi:hypothetical protein
MTTPLQEILPKWDKPREAYGYFIEEDERWNLKRINFSTQKGKRIGENAKL